MLDIMIIQVYHKRDCFIPAMCDNPLYVFHIILSDSVRDPPTSDKTCVVLDFLLLEPIQEHAWRMENGNWKHPK